MSRPREFDIDTAIDAALNVFWTRGVHRSSVDQLVRATGLARSSLYNTFSGKKSLLEQAIQRYVDSRLAVFDKIFAQPSFREALAELTRSVIADNCAGRGCLLINSAAGLMPGEASEQQILRQGLDRMLASLSQRVARAQRDGEVDATPAPDAVALMICSTLSGLRIFHKAGFSTAQLEAAAELAFQKL